MRQVGRYAATVVVSVVVSALVLSGCTGEDDEPDADESPSQSTAPTSTDPTDPTSAATADTPEAPELPTDATQQTEAGAEAFVRHYIELINYAQSTGDGAPLSDLSAQSCSVCQSFASRSDSLYAEGGRSEGGDFTVNEISPLPLDYGADSAFYVETDVSPQTLFEADGTESEYPGGPYPFGAYATWTNDGWEMTWLAIPTE